MGKTMLWLILLLLPASAGAARKGVSNMGEFTLSSPAFTHGGSIPAVHTCDGRDTSPPLAISGVPAKAQSLVLIMDDPDAPMGTWVHWVIWNIPPRTAELRNGAPEGSSEGRNSWQRTGYGGPCPPSGIHRYYFKLYALDSSLSLPAGAGKAEVERAMKGHLLAGTELMGTYKRR